MIAYRIDYAVDRYRRLQVPKSEKPSMLSHSIPSHNLEDRLSLSGETIASIGMLLLYSKS